MAKASQTNLNLVNLNVKSSGESGSLEVLLGKPGDWKKEKHILVQPCQSQAIQVLPCQKKISCSPMTKGEIGDYVNEALDI